MSQPRTVFQTKTKTIASCLLISLPLLSGCQTEKMATTSINKANRAATSYLAKRPVVASDIRHHKTPWYFGQGDRMRLQDVRMETRVEKVLPEFMMQKKTWTDSRPVTIYDIARWLTEETGIPVEVHTPRVLKTAGLTGTSGGSMPGTGMPGGGMPFGGPGVPFPPTSAGSLSPAGQGLPNVPWNRKLQMHIVDKPLSEFLDIVASGMGLFWDWNGHSIAFYRSATKVYRITPPPVQSSVNDTISDVGATGILGLLQAMGGSGGLGMMGGLGSGMMGGYGGGLTGGGLGSGMMGGYGGGLAGGGLGGSGMMGGLGGLGMMGGLGGQNSGMPGQNVSVMSSSSVWQELQTGVQNVLGNKGSFTIMPSSGLVAVTTTPAIMRQMDMFIHRVNSTFSRQVWVEVKVLEVKLDSQDQNDINWNAVIHGIAGAVSGGGIGLTSASQIFSSGNTSPITSTTFSLPGSSTTALVNSLSTRYQTSQVTTLQVRTLNDQAAPVQDVTSQTYLAEVMAGIAGIGQATFSQDIPSSVTVGFTANILPHLLGDDEHMILEMSVDLSVLLGITTAPGSNGGASIQLPEVASRSFMQRIRIRSGQTAIVSGFENVNSVMQQNGSFGNPNNFMFGGGVNAQKNRTKIVILITPIVEQKAA